MFGGISLIIFNSHVPSAQPHDSAGEHGRKQPEIGGGFILSA